MAISKIEDKIYTPQTSSLTLLDWISVCLWPRFLHVKDPLGQAAVPMKIKCVHIAY